MKPETFIPIEDSFARVLNNLWKAAVKDAWPSIRESLEDDDVTSAVQLIASIDVDTRLTEKKERQLRLLMKTALNFGAAASGSGIKNSVFIDEDPDILQESMQMLLTSARENMRRFAAAGASMAAEKQLREAQERADANLVAKGEIDPGKIEDMILNNGRAVASIGANQTTSRLAAFGALTQLEKEGRVSYRLQAVLDKRTSKICLRLHGKKFEVKIGLDHISSVVRMTNPDDLRTADPWIPSDKQVLRFLEKTGDNDPDLVANKWHVPPFHPHCYLPSVKVMTQRGFVPFEDVMSDDLIYSLDPKTRKTRWSGISKRIKHFYSGQAVRVSNPGSTVSLETTESHPFLFDRRYDRGKSGKCWELGTYSLSGFQSPGNKILAAADKDSSGPEGQYRVEMCALLGWYVSEGYMHHKWPCIVQHLPEHRKTIESLGRNLWPDMRVWKDRFSFTGVTVFRNLCPSGKSYEKTIPDYVFDSGPSGRQAFWDAMVAGDGHGRDRGCFGFLSKCEVVATSSPQLRDGLVRLLQSLGYGASIRTQKGKKVCHKNGNYTGRDVWIVSKLTPKRRHAQAEIFYYEGWVYDLELKRDHIFLVEHEGRISWQSNCRTIVIDADIEVAEAFLEELPIEETASKKALRLANEATYLVRVDAKKFKADFEAQDIIASNDPPLNKLDWNEGRLAALRKVEGPMDEHPMIGILDDGQLGVIDGRHRIALAAERDQTIVVATDKLSVENMGSSRPKWVKSVKKPDPVDDIDPTGDASISQNKLLPGTVPGVKFRPPAQALARAKVMAPDELLDHTAIEKALDAEENAIFSFTKRKNLELQDEDPVEYMLLIDTRTGKPIDVPNKGSEVGVEWSAKAKQWVVANWNDPDAAASLAFHHNHPLSTPFPLSALDFHLMTANKLIREMWAHMDETTSYVVRRTKNMDDPETLSAVVDFNSELWGDNKKPGALAQLHKMMSEDGSLPKNMDVTEFEAMAQWAYNFALRDVFGFDIKFHGATAVNWVRARALPIDQMTEFVKMIAQSKIKKHKVTVAKRAKKALKSQIPKDALEGIPDEGFTRIQEQINKGRPKHVAGKYRKLYDLIK